MMVQRDLIFDVGMHLGEDANFYLKKGFRVVGVEASPALSVEVTDRLASSIKSGRLTLRNVAISDEDGPVRFFENHKFTEWGTIRSAWAERNARLGAPSSVTVVQGVRFERLLEEFGIPYFLKIDIEGADVLCLEALRGAKERPRYLSFESTKTSWADLEKEFDLLCELGYRRFKVVNQGDVAKQVPPKPAREGIFVDHRFAYGSSGLFGEETPGSWLTRGQATAVYRRIFTSYRLFGDNGLVTRSKIARKIVNRIGLGAKWYDTHAAQ